MDFDGPERILSPPPSYHPIAPEGSIPTDSRIYTLSPNSMDTRDNSYSRPSLDDDGDSGFNTHVSSPRTPSSSSDTQSVNLQANGARSFGPPMSAVGIPPPDLSPIPSHHSPTSPVRSLPSIPQRPQPQLPPPPEPRRPRGFSSGSAISSYSLPGDVTYQFKNLAMNCIALVPEPSPDHELYRVEVFLNCFNPTSHISRITKRSQDGTEFGLVAEFEMGISAEPARLGFYGHESREMSKIFYPYRNVPSKNPDRWCWKHGHRQFDWEITVDPNLRREVYKCFRRTDRASETRLATLTFMGSGGGMLTAPTMLWVSAAGHEMFDDIFVSALLAERKRLSPRDGKRNEQLFNHKDHRE